MDPELTGALANLMTFLQDPTNVIVAHLAQNNISSEKDDVVLADFVECTFPGYAPIPLTNFTPYLLGTDAYGEADSDPLAWVATTITVPQPISAVYLTIAQGGAPAALLQPIIFPEPSLIAASGEVFMYQFTFQEADLGV